MAYESIRFYYRSDTTTARYSRSGSTGVALQPLIAGLTTDAAAIGGTALKPGSNASGRGGYLFPGFNNCADTVAGSYLIRVRPLSIGGVTTGAINFWWNINSGANALAISLYHNTDGAARITISNNIGQQSTFNLGTVACTTTGYDDIILTYTGLTGSSVALYFNNTLSASTTMSFDFNATPATNGTITCANMATIEIGRHPGSPAVNGFGQSNVNEFAIFNKVLTAATINAMQLVSTGGVTSTGALAGATRTSWLDVPYFDALSYTDPGVANVLSTAGYTYAGVSKTGTWLAASAANVKTGVSFGVGGASTGTYDGSDRHTDPGVANVRQGTTYKSNSTSNNRTGTLDLPATTDVRSGTTYDGGTKTGTLQSEVWSTISAANIRSGINQIQNSVTVTGTLLWTSLTAAQIKSGVNQIQDGLTQTGSYTGEVWSTLSADNIKVGITQIQNSVTITGTLQVPIASSGTAGTIDIGNLKEQIRYVLWANNTTTGAPVSDLSANMVKRVPTDSIFKFNPEKLPIDAAPLPAVYVFTDKKSIMQKTISKDQVVGKREAEVNFTIIGAVWNQTMANILEDPADKDLENLMENIEKILRSYPTLGNYTRWQFPTDVTYHALSYDEKAHLRLAMMALQCKVYY